MTFATRVWRWFWPHLPAVRVRARQLGEAETQLAIARERLEYYVAMEAMLRRRVARLRKEDQK